MFWRPAHELRGAYKPWFLTPSLNALEISQRAARAIYRCFNLMPGQAQSANDDGKRW